LRLMARKAALLVNRREMIDTEDPSMYAEWSWPLRVLGPVAQFGVLFPLAVLGVVLTWGERRRLGVFYALALAYGASVVVFYVVARYRYPLVPFLAVFSAPGVLGLVDLFREPRRLRLGCFVATTIAAVLSNWPMGSASGMRAVAES